MHSESVRARLCPTNADRRAARSENPSRPKRESDRLSATPTAFEGVALDPDAPVLAGGQQAPTPKRQCRPARPVSMLLAQTDDLGATRDVVERAFGFGDAAAAWPRGRMCRQHRNRRLSGLSPGANYSGTSHMQASADTSGRHERTMLFGARETGASVRVSGTLHRRW